MSGARVVVAILLSLLTCYPYGYSQTASSSQPSATPPPDLTAVFQMSVSLNVKPEIPTSYDRTSIALESNPQMNFEVVGIRDETRGITAKGKSNSGSLEALFGPKSGLGDRIVVSALVRVPRQAGEKIVRKTIRLRNVPLEIWSRAERDGRVRIDVELDSSPKLAARSGMEDAAARQAAVTSVQEELTIKLAGTDYKLLRVYESDARVLLEAGLNALAVLDQLPEVIKIKEDVYSRRVFVR